MKLINSLLIIGGDIRQLYMAEYLEEKGFSVSIFGLPDNKRKPVSDIKSSVKNADVIILPLPISKDGKSVNSTVKINDNLDNIISYINEETILFAGMIDKGTESKLKNKKLKFYDYFKNEELTVKNTVPTVQGIIKSIIDNIDYTIHSSQCAVFGYGRVGKITAETLSSLGADVTVCARKKSDLANAKNKKFNGCLINEFHKISNKFDIIINTVPFPVIDRKIIEKLNNNCLIIDVSSAPYGTDFAVANEFDIKAIQCPSLPGKVAPKTSGIIIGEAIIEILKEENLWIK